MMSIKTVNALSHYTDWTVGHVHSGALGWVGLVSMGTLYYMIPRVFGRNEMYSVKAITLHFWVSTIGIVLYIAAMWIAGVMQGLMWRAVNDDGTLTYTFVESVKATYPYYMIRLIGGVLYFTGSYSAVYAVDARTGRLLWKHDPEVWRHPGKVRLVFAVEFDTAFFGGDPDNFNFPRYDLDFSFLRLYENGKAVTTPEYLKWNASAPKEGEPVFVAGNPGHTDRLNTVAHLEFLRDKVLPISLDRMRRLELLYGIFSERSKENARRAKGGLDGVAGLALPCGRQGRGGAPGFGVAAARQVGLRQRGGLRGRLGGARIDQHHLQRGVLEHPVEGVRRRNAQAQQGAVEAQREGEGDLQRAEPAHVSVTRLRLCQVRRRLHR